MLTLCKYLIDTGVDIDIESKKTLAIWKVLSPNFCCPPDFMTHDFQLYAKITLAFTAVTVPNDNTSCPVFYGTQIEIFFGIFLLIQEFCKRSTFVNV